MFKELINNVREKYDQMNKENELLDSLLNKTDTIKNLFPIQPKDFIYSEYIIELITNNAPDINKDKAKIINQIIPITETIIDVFYSKELKTNIEYYFVLTNKYLWLFTQNAYGAFNFDNLNIDIIKNNLLSKVVLLNNVLFEINGTNSKIEKFIKIINDKNTREQEINNSLKQYCGITPIYQLRNKFGTGISIDINKNIIFHDKKNNYLYNINDIKHLEILLDNTIYFTTNNEVSGKIGSFQSDCYSISLRVNLDNLQILIPILETNSSGNKYNINDTIITKNINFAKQIINKIESIRKPY